MRLKSIAVLLASLVLIPAAPASAGTITTQNSCLVSMDGVWHHVNMTFSGTGSPSPVAPGSGLSLTRATARTTIPHYMVDYAGNLGLLQEGVNEFPSKVWIAVAAPGTAQGVQVVPVDVVARTTTTFSGGAYQSATPVDVTVALPDTAWTAGTAPVGFRQAAGGTLPRLPVGPGGSSVTPLGSLFISSRVGNAVTVNMDCLPGNGEGRDTEMDPTPVAAGAFETVPVDAAAPPTPTVTKKPVVSLRTTRLKRTGTRVSVALTCAGAPCKGSVTAKYAGGTAAKTLKYSLAAGALKTYKLALSAKARRSLENKSLLINVKITAEGGKTVSKKLRLK